jgi:hypothetical protein
MKTRLQPVEKFSTFLSIADSHRFILRWHTDYKLKRNIEKFNYQELLDCDVLAYRFLTNLRLNHELILQHHLTSYLQEVSYWATRYVYCRLRTIIDSLTLDECFLFASEIVTQPQKLLVKYQSNGGSKITTYAHTRLKTTITDKIYMSRNWKLLTNWGLLKKIGKSKRQNVLKEISGLREEKLEEYLLVWQCFVDNYVSSSPHRGKSLSPPNLSQLTLMTNQYNLLAKKFLTFPSKLTVEDFKNRVEFCGEKARLFVNPISIEYPEDKKINLDDNSKDYLINLEKNQAETEINYILARTFNTLNLVAQSIFYLSEGLGLSQQKIIKTIQLTHPNFTGEQYQLSREIEKIRRYLLDTIIKHQKGEKTKIDKGDIKLLIQPLKQWLAEYIESEILLLCRECYQEIDNKQQELLKENYFKSLVDNPSIMNHIPPQLINLLRKKLESKLKLKLIDDTVIQNHLSLWLERFFHQYFNQI